MKKKKLKVRKDWKINPATKVKESDKKYNRKKTDAPEVDDTPLNNDSWSQLLADWQRALRERFTQP